MSYTFILAQITDDAVNGLCLNARAQSQTLVELAGRKSSLSLRRTASVQFRNREAFLRPSPLDQAHSRSLLHGLVRGEIISLCLVFRGDDGSPLHFHERKNQVACRSLLLALVLRRSTL
jgi:hypothetical protein